MKPDKIDLLLVGSGPHHLTLAAYLQEKDPQMVKRMMVADPSGAWLTQWDYQMGAQGIVHLRSSSVHHPDPDPTALRVFGRDRKGEFWPPYMLPGVPLFRQFCAQVIERRGLKDLVIPGKIIDIKLKNKPPGPFEVYWEDGSVTEAKAVSFALGGGLPKPIPKASFSPMGRIQHSDSLDLRSLVSVGETIGILGGGLTAAHLALGALRKGNKVRWFTLRSPEVKLFDAEPRWIGPRRMKGFLEEPDFYRRRELIREARGGGAVTGEMMEALHPFFQAGHLVHHTLKRDWKVEETSDRLTLLSEEIWALDRLWVCSGSQWKPEIVPGLPGFMESYPASWVDDLPLLDPGLNWPGLNLYFMGIPAALRIGPTARNLPGARKAAEILTQRLPLVL